MALSAGEMKNKIIIALKTGADNAVDANKKLGDAILEYICEKIDITYGWSAATTSSPPDPDETLSFDATVTGSGILAPPNPESEFPLTLQEMLDNLATLIKGLVISAPEGFMVAPLAFNPAGQLSVTMNGEDAQEDAVLTLCTQIIDSITTSFVNSIPGTGSHEQYVGATTSMVIA